MTKEDAACGSTPFENAGAVGGEATEGPPIGRKLSRGNTPNFCSHMQTSTLFEIGGLLDLSMARDGWQGGGA